MLLIKNSCSDLTPVGFITSDLNGKWIVEMKGDQYNCGEMLEFNENTINYYKNPEQTPSASSEYTLSETNILCAKDLNIEMTVYMISENRFVFIEEKNGIVWEISRYTH